MFNIDKAVQAAFAVCRDPGKRAGFVRFLIRTARQDEPVTQWRTIGAETRMAEAFLKDLGFGEGDYEAYSSRLDPRVVDLKWGASGKYETLRDELGAIEHNAGRIGAVSPLGCLLFAAWNGEEIPPVSEGRPDAAPAEVRGFPFKLGPVTADRLHALYDVATKLADGETVDGIEKRFDECLGTVWNGVSESTVTAIKNHVALRDGHLGIVADPWLVEAACRLLNVALKCSEIPPVAVFGPPNGETQTLTVCRYLRRDERVPGFDRMLCGIAAQDWGNPSQDRSGNVVENPLKTYLTNDAEKEAGMDLTGREILLAFTAAELNRYDRARTLAFASSRGPFWRYVQALYEGFYSLHVGIEPHARIGFGPSVTPWADFAGRWNNVLEEQAGMSNVAAAVFALVVTPREVAVPWDPSAYGPEDKPVRILGRTERIDASQFEHDNPSWRDWAAEAYSLVHYGGLEVLERNDYRYSRNAQREFNALQKFRRRYDGRTKPSTVAAASAYGSNRYLEPKYDRYGSPTYSEAGAFLSGVASVVKAHAPNGGNLVPVFARDTKAHPNQAVVSNVYTRLGWEDAPVESGKPFEEWRDRFAAEQLAVPETEPDRCAFTVVVETNVSVSQVLCTPEFRRDMADMAWNTLGKGCTYPTCFGAHPDWNLNGDDYFRKMFTAECPVSNLSVEGTVVARGHEFDQQHALKVAVMGDASGRAHVIVSFAGPAARYALATFRYRTGLSVIEAWMLAKSPSATRGTIRVDDGGWNTNALFERVVSAILDRGRGTQADWEEWENWPDHGFGPIHGQMHTRNQRYGFDRQEYLNGEALEARAVIDNG